mgnify:CR=1 FL=1
MCPDRSVTYVPGPYNAVAQALLPNATKLVYLLLPLKPLQYFENKVLDKCFVL